jgi:uncharacterized membrane protein YbhN (UPF0104 family)
MRKVLTRRTVPLLLGSIIFVFCVQTILESFQWAEIYKILKQANLIELLGAGSVAVLSFSLIRTWRWFILLNSLGIKINYIDLHLCNAAAMSLTIITPFQSGEIVKVELLKKGGLIERFSGYSSFLTERIIDLFVILCLASISLLVNFNVNVGIKGSQSNIFAFCAIVLLLLIGGVFTVNKIKLKGKLGQFLEPLRLCTRNVQSFGLVILLTFGAWLMVAIGWQVCLYSISIDIGFKKSVALMSITTIINILSFIPGAVGISEVSITEFLSRMNLNIASAQAGAIILRFYSLLIIIVGIIHFAFWKALKSRKINLPKPR